MKKKKKIEGKAFYAWSDHTTSVVRISKELKKKLDVIAKKQTQEQERKVTTMYLINQAVEEFLKKE